MQTTIINNFNENQYNENQYNEKLQEKFKYRPSSSSSFKKTKLQDDFKTIPESKRKNDDNVFDLILIDIKKTSKYEMISCIKKNMYDEDLKYISVSYRWGELKEEEEQLLQTPDYIAHVTSFDLLDLIHLCQLITHEPDLKNIPYLWIDAISVDQQNYARKKETLLKMKQIYQNATYILAIPDLHRAYLKKDPMNRELMDLIWKYKDTIHDNIYSIQYHSDPMYSSLHMSKCHPSSSSESDSILQKIIYKMMKIIESRKSINEKEELRKVYQFLAYLIKDWSQRTWVISEYQMAKEKYIQHKRPLKYIFLSLLSSSYHESSSLSSPYPLHFKPFFSWMFNEQQNKKIIMNQISYHHKSTIYYYQIDDHYKLIHFLKCNFIQHQSPLDKILKSSTSKNEDRFYAILPLWKEHNHYLKDENMISRWQITDMLSVRLKLYHIMNGGNDLWNQARLLYQCSIQTGKRTLLPSFATYYQSEKIIIELDAIDFVYDLYCYYPSTFSTPTPMNYINNNNNERNKKTIKDYILDYKKKYGSIFKQNLIGIQFHYLQPFQQCHLTMIVNHYFLFHMSSFSFHEKELTSLVLKDNHHLQLIYLPFFTYDISEWKEFLFLNEHAIPFLSGILLLGNMDVNRWVQVDLSFIKTTIGKPSFYSAHDFIFRIY